MVSWMLVVSFSWRACIPPVLSTTRSEVGSALSSILGSSPPTRVPSQDMTRITRSCAAAAAAPARSVRRESLPLSGPKRCVPDGIDTSRGYMATELDHSFSTTKSIEDSLTAITDLERVVPCVEGGRVLETTGPDSVRAEIDMSMGAMSLKFTGTVEVAEKDPAAHRALLRVKSREAGGQGHANADVTFQLEEGGGSIHTKAQITGKAASMGEGVVIGVLDALIKDFTSKVGEL
jgi:uncharacterized protein